MAVVSGKGGVGKSTVAVNLAVALALRGQKTALIDADFYGPSIPTLLGGGRAEGGPDGKIKPPEKFGLKYISIGFFLEKQDDAVIWRGPLFNKALRQLFEDVAWGDVDHCIVDMPPGTGDAPLSLSALIPISGALVVTTPQEVALADVRKSINMLAKLNIDVLGIVENMSGFVAPDGAKHDIFGAGGGEKLARRLNVPLLATLALDPRIRQSCDEGIPAAADPDSEAGRAFGFLALKILDILGNKPRNKTSLRIISQQ